MAITAGVGGGVFTTREIFELKINMNITGNIRVVPLVESLREFQRIVEKSIMSATNYTKKKYGWIAKIRYIEKLGVPAEFLEGR